MSADRDHIDSLLEKALAGRLSQAEQAEFDAYLADHEDLRQEFDALQAYDARLQEAGATFRPEQGVQPPMDLNTRILSKVKTRAVPACLDRIHSGLSGCGPIPLWDKGAQPHPVTLPDCGYRLVFDKRSLSVHARDGETSIGFLIVRAEPTDGDQQLVTPEDLAAGEDAADDLTIVFHKSDGYYTVETDRARVVDACVEWQIRTHDIMHAAQDTFRLGLSTHNQTEQQDTTPLARVAGAAPDALEHVTRIVPVEDEAVEDGYVCYCLMLEDTSDEEFEQSCEEILKQYRSTESQKVAGLRGLYLTLPRKTADALQTAWKRTQAPV